MQNDQVNTNATEQVPYTAMEGAAAGNTRIYRSLWESHFEHDDVDVKQQEHAIEAATAYVRETNYTRDADGSQIVN